MRVSVIKCDVRVCLIVCQASHLRRVCVCVRVQLGMGVEAKRLFCFFAFIHGGRTKDG